jgi:hypothetical protein
MIKSAKSGEVSSETNFEVDRACRFLVGRGGRDELFMFFLCNSVSIALEN